jgi:outer membrane biosynthesis protein TonB
MSDVRADIEAALTRAEAAAAPQPEEKPTEVKAEEKPAEEKPAEIKAEEKPAEEKPAEEKPAGEQRPAEEKKPEIKAEEKPDEQKPAEQKPVIKVRPPESWKPAIREKHWTTLPLEVQAEIHRRERQIDIALQQSAESRKFAEQFGGLFAQHKNFIEYEKTPPAQIVSNLFNIASSLRFGAPAQKAQVAAQIIQGFGVDVKLLDQALALVVSGNGAPANGGFDPNALDAAISRHMAPFRDFMQNVTTQRENVVKDQNKKMEDEINTFANDPKNEYFEIVKDTMADLLDAAANRGEQMSLQVAYQRAILAHSDLAATVTQKEVSKAASNLNAPAQKSRELAGMSVTGAPSGSAPSANVDTVRGAIEAAIAKHSGRQ